MSVTYAASDGKRNISPNVQITTVAATVRKSRANASAPKPVPNRNAPMASVRRCGQCAVAELIGTSRTTIRSVLIVKKRP